LARIKALYESQQQPCQPELMAYFVRLDPAYADRVFHSGPWDMHVMPPPCTVQYFLRTPPLAMGPPLEKFMSAYLMHSDVFVKTTAAQSLGRYGSAAALPALWDTLRYFHEYWKGKGAELAGNGQSVLLEVELRNAIARGRGWLATESDLRTIEALCSSVQCLGETRQDLSAWERPLRIELTDQPSGAASGKVAQYFGLNGLDAVEAKLVQFPHGAQFTVYASGKESSKMADALMKFAAEHGMAVTLP
jgi:hypothetical protein